MYQIFVRSFYDSNGDGIGDLQGIIRKLDHIQSLGANILWLTPIHPSPTYHGYDITDYYAIHPDFGTLDDFHELITAVHKRDMYILIDYVVNHTSNKHPFFLDAMNNPASETGDYFRWQDKDHARYHGFAGGRGMPEINYQSRAARDYLLDIARYWLDPDGDGDPSDGVDGLRCDVALGPPFDFWAELRSTMIEINPDSVLLAESWLGSSPILKEYLQGDGFNAVFDFPVYHALAGIPHNNGNSVISGTIPVDFLHIAEESAAHWYPAGSHLVRFINNHDTNRVASETEGDYNKARAGAVWLLTTSGTPMLYYGEEIGMAGSKNHIPGYHDEPRREPMDWYAAENGPGMTTWYRPPGRHNAPHDGISVEEQETDPKSLLNLYRTLGDLRWRIPDLRHPEIKRLPIQVDYTYAVQRGESTVVLINFGYQTITGTLPEVIKHVYLQFGLQLEAGQNFTLQPDGYAILSYQAIQ